VKYLILLGVIALAVWYLRHKKTVTRQPAAPRPAAKQPSAAEMSPCKHCGLHMPASDMVQGPDGLYCSSEHRQLEER
jgi:uncharacterized protein